MIRALSSAAGAALLGVLMSCSGRTGCKGQSGDGAAPTKKNESPLVAGRVICKEPVWIGVEGGKEGRIHLNATDEQLAKLRAKYKTIALFPPGIVRVQPYFFEFDLADPKQERPTTYTVMAATPLPFRETDLFPIAIVGIDEKGHEEEIAVGTPYRRPLWEKLPTKFFDIRFTRYPAHAATGMAKDMTPEADRDRWCAALSVDVVNEHQNRLVERYSSIEIRVSLLPNAVTFTTENLRAGHVVTYVQGDPISEDLDVSLVSITGVTRGGEREPLHLPRDKK